MKQPTNVGLNNTNETIKYPPPPSHSGKGMGCTGEVHNMDGKGEYFENGRFAEDVAGYVAEIEGTGLSSATIGNRVRMVKAVLGRIGWTDPRETDAFSVEAVIRDSFSVGSVTYRQYSNTWFSFVSFCVDGHRGRCLPYYMSSEFSAALASLMNGFESGLPRVAYRFPRDVGCAFRWMFRTLGNLGPEDIDSDVMTDFHLKLEGCIKPDRIDDLCRAMGRFIMAVTGEDPYREYLEWNSSQDVMARIQQVLESHEFGEELWAYACAMEARGLHDCTIRSTISSCRMCLEALWDSGWHGRLDEITAADFQRLPELLVNVKETTCHGYLVSFGGFLDFMTGRNPMKEARILWNPFEQTVERRFIIGHEWEALMAVAGPEEMVILALAGTMGLRRFEIAGLKLDDIRNGRVVVRGKGHGPNGKMVVLIMTDAVERAIAEYMPVRDSVLARFGDRSQGRLLVHSKRKGGEPMTPDCVGRRIHRLGERVGVDVSTHCLRRYFATTLYYQLGCDLNTLRRMLRHESVDTTLQCYVMSDDESMRSAFEKISRRLFGAPGDA